MESLTPPTAPPPKKAGGESISSGSGVEPIPGATPLMQQYLRLKERYKSEVLFFRLGDFYEMFHEDALRAAPLLEVALTKRQSTPMCGIPHHAAQTYIAKLLKAGLSVALAEQMEDPKTTKGMVKRDVVRVITPGTLTEDELLPSKANNFLVAIALQSAAVQDGTHTVKAAPRDGRWALAAADVSTGQLWVGESGHDLHWHQLRGQLSRLDPSEVLLVGPDSHASVNDLGLKAVVRLEPAPVNASNLTHKAVQSIQAYLEKDHPQAAAGLGTPQPLPSEASGVMLLDETAVRHLELVDSSDPLRDGPTLIGVLDRCRTPMGSRLLRWWMLHPSIHRGVIEERLEQVEDFAAVPQVRVELAALLREISDIDRITVRAKTGTASPRDMAALRLSLNKLPFLREELSRFDKQALGGHFSGLIKGLDAPPELISILMTQLANEPPAKIAQGGVIRAEFNKDLDELRALRQGGRRWIADLETSERARTGIGSLKVGYNDVFGYYLEVSKSNLSKVPPEWIRKQTMANGERYVTQALKEQEEKILHAEEKIIALETALYNEMVHQVARFGPSITVVSAALARLDALVSLAAVATENGYVKPRITDGEELTVRGGRHPVIERRLGRDRFIANDVALGAPEARVGIITGPNMAGKSTYLRQNALIVIMAQMGSFVPAESAAIGLVDRIFTRIGASDRLAQGQSTFMVEMEEVAALLAHSTARSLLILDEVGRGTSTYDGMSIAWAVIDHLVTREGTKAAPRTLFATHYFELTQLAGQLPGVFNAHATAKEWPGPDGRRQVVFLYQIISGAADRSYGIHVAEMAGLPVTLIDRARTVLHELESGNHNLARAFGDPSPKEQLEFFSVHPLTEDFKNLKIEEMTPLEALNTLAKFKRKISKSGSQLSG